MRSNEEAVLKEFKAAGWSALRNGWPDYLLVRTNSDGKLEFMALEVKCGRDSVSGHQEAIHVALRSAGIEVVVKTIKKGQKSKEAVLI